MRAGYYNKNYSGKNPASQIIGALKLEKKCNFKSAKNIICIFKNGKKVNFCTRKTTKNAIVRL